MENEQYQYGQNGQVIPPTQHQAPQVVYVQQQAAQKRYQNNAPYHDPIQFQDRQNLFNNADTQKAHIARKTGLMKDLGMMLTTGSFFAVLFLAFLKIMDTPPSDSEILQNQEAVAEVQEEPQLLIYEQEDGKMALHSENDEKAAPKAKQGKQPVLYSEPQEVEITRPDGSVITCTRVEMIKGKPDSWCVDEFGQPLKTVNQMQAEQAKRETAKTKQQQL